jgi:hypothetical protein
MLIQPPARTASSRRRLRAALFGVPCETTVSVSIVLSDRVAQRHLRVHPSPSYQRSVAAVWRRSWKRKRRAASPAVELIRDPRSRRTSARVSLTAYTGNATPAHLGVVEAATRNNREVRLDMAKFTKDKSWSSIESYVAEVQGQGGGRQARAESITRRTTWSQVRALLLPKCSSVDVPSSTNVGRHCWPR